MSVPCSNVLWPQRLPRSSPSSPWLLPSSLLSPCSLYSQPCWPQCGPLRVLGVVMPHSILLLLFPLLGTFFPRCSHGPFPYLLQISDQISNVLERPTWLPNLKLQHLQKAATSLVSFPNFFSRYLSPSDQLPVLCICYFLLVPLPHTDMYAA